MRILKILAVTLSVSTMPVITYACGDDDHVNANKLPNLVLNDGHRELLQKVNKAPKTALDFYALLPASFFKGLENNLERRIWYINLKSITDSYISAHYYFDCDSGGFGIEMRLYRTDANPVIAIHTGKLEKIFDDNKPRGGDPSIHVKVPHFYSYANNKWQRISTDILPKINPKNILFQYYNKYDAYKKYTNQEKYIWLDYELTDSTQIQVTGRENFMDPRFRNVWGIYVWDKSVPSFVLKSSNN